MSEIKSNKPMTLNELDVRAWWNALSPTSRLEKVADLSLAESTAWSAPWEELGQQRRWMIKEALGKVYGSS